MEQISILESEQEDVIMDCENYDTILPYCAIFSQKATEILNKVHVDFDLFLLNLLQKNGIDSSSTSSRTQFVNDFQLKKNYFLQTIIGHNHLQRLYQNQLEGIRDILGKRYEFALQELFATTTTTTSNNNINDPNHSTNKKREQQEQIKNQITKSIEDFRSAAFLSIPIICRLGQICYKFTTTIVSHDSPHQRDDTNLYNYNIELNGFLEDMKQITQIYQDLDFDWNLGCASMLEEEEDDDNQNNNKLPKVKKWYHKLLSKCLVLGVNYVQGWLAFQNMQREADERDALMPKFPLF